MRTNYENDPRLKKWRDSVMRTKKNIFKRRGGKEIEQQLKEHPEIKTVREYAAVIKKER